MDMSMTSIPPRPYSYGKRLFYGSWWSFVTLVLAIAALTSIVHLAIWDTIVALVGVYFLGRYAYRIWNWEAKHLVFLFII